jgi:iron complex outermembrane recepter protein
LFHGSTFGGIMNLRVSGVRRAILSAIGGSAVLPQIGLAQSDSGAGLEEIVVTATRREQNLQEVPISIVAITGDNLELRGLDSLEDVGQSVPNVVITGGGGGTGGTTFRMRGIPNVGTYVDGVWQVGTAGLLVQELVDTDRIEVLRGPQGTMFGRDSTGGALRIWTKRPSEDFGADITGTVGSYDRRDVKATFNLPLTENLLTKWTGASLYRDGYIQNLTVDQKNGGVDQTVFRGDMVWTPTDRLDFRFNYQQNESTFTEPRVQDAIFDTFAEMGQGIGIREFYGLAGEEPFTPETQQAGYPGGRVGKWENRSDMTEPNHYLTEQASVEINLDLGDSMNLQFLTAKTDQDSDSWIDWDNSQYALVNDLNRSRLEVLSQEIQLTGGGDRIQWLAGVYYWDQKTLSRNARWVIEEFRAGSPLQRLSAATVFASPHCQNIPVGLLTCQQVFAQHSPGGSSGPYDTLGIAEQDGWALFGEVTVKLSEKLGLTMGLRKHDQSGYNRTLGQIPGVTSPKPTTTNTWHTGGDPFAGTIINAATGQPYPTSPFEFDKVTPRLVLQNQFNDNVMGYVSYAGGFNSGGVSVATIAGVRTLFPYEPSTLKNFEVGMRSDLAGGRVRFNATLFHTVWEDIQANGVVRDPNTGAQLPTLLTTNVGDAEAEGVEFELTFLPTESLVFNLNVGLLDTGYTDIATGTMSGHLALTLDTDFQDAPETTYSLGFQHTAMLGNGGSFVSRLDYNYQGQFWRQDPFLRVSGYQAVPDTFEESGESGFVNARFYYEPADGNWQVAVFGTNLTNEYMINSGFFHGIWGFDFATVARPREAGASLTFRF